MFMDLGRTVRKGEATAVDLVRIRQLNEISFRQYALHLTPEGYIHAVIVIGMKEAAGFEVAPQLLNLASVKWMLP